MARIVLADDNGALYGAPAAWLSSVYLPSADLRTTLAGYGFYGEPTPEWVHFGDSLTAAGSSGNWVGKFAAAVGHDAYNGGVGGETAEQIHARMTGAEGDPYRDRHFTITAGRNGFKITEPDVIVDLVHDMVKSLVAIPRGFVFDIAPWETENLPATEGDTRDRLETLNAALEDHFPEHYLPVFTYLRTQEAATAAGIVFTAQDDTDIANGITPASFRSDAGHLNDTGGSAFKYFVQKEAQRRGFVTPRPMLAADLLTNYAVVPDPSVGLGWTGSGGGTIPYTNTYGVHTYETVTGMDLPTAARFKGLAGVSSYPEITAGRTEATRAPIPAAGGQFTASLQVRASKAVDMQVRIKPYGTGAGDTWGPKVTLQAGVPTRMAVTTTLAAGTTHIAVAAIAAANSMSDESYMDVTALMVTAGSTAHPYRDGNSVGWSWSGVAKQSTSSGPTPAQQPAPPR